MQQLDLTPKRQHRRKVATPAKDDDAQVDEAGDVADAAQVDVDVDVDAPQQAQVDAPPPQMDADGDEDSWLVFVLGLILIAMVQMYILN